MQIELNFIKARLLWPVAGLFVFCGNGLGQNAGAGYWTGTMTRDGAVLDVSFEFKIVEQKLAGFFNSPSQKASGIPLDNVQASGDSLAFQLMSEPVTVFRGAVSKDRIEAKFTQEGFSDGLLVLNRAVHPPADYTFVDSAFKSDGLSIACRVYLPKGKGPFPAVVFLHGSGGEGMFANQYLAEYLAAKGIAALIQDKRGVGRSTGSWMTADFDKLTDDYAAAIAFLKTFGRIDQKRIGIYGHSQGGTIAPLLAAKSTDVAFVIAAAAIGDTVYKQDLYRVENSLRANGFSADDTRAAMDYYGAWLETARTDRGFEKLDALNAAAKDKKWFEWVEAPPRDHWIWKYYLATGNFEPLAQWKKVRVPVLLVYGENDRIEDVRGYAKNIEDALFAGAQNRDVTTLILPRAQHNLCIFPEKEEKFFWWHLAPGYQDLLAGWIKYRFGK